MRQRDRRATAPTWSSVRHVAGLGSAAVGCLALAAVLGARVATLVADVPASGRRQVEDLVETAVTGTGTLVALWLGASALLALACLGIRAAGATWRTGERLVHRCAPALVRRSLVLLVGAGLGLGVATSASATDPAPAAVPVAAGSVTVTLPAGDLGWQVSTSAPSPTSAPSHATPTAAAAPDPGVSPATVPATASPAATAAAAATPAAAAPATTAPATTAPAATAPATTAPAAARAATEPTAAAAADRLVVAPPARGAAAAETGTVVVVRGDSLWRIAQRHLPPDAGAAEIAAAWPAWYTANAATIGDDPGVLLPGQVLTIPAQPVGTDGAES